MKRPVTDKDNNIVQYVELDDQSESKIKTSLSIVIFTGVIVSTLLLALFLLIGWSSSEAGIQPLTAAVIIFGLFLTVIGLVIVNQLNIIKNAVTRKSSDYDTEQKEGITWM